MSASTGREPETDDIFAGGGEMGALMRAHDWEQTLIGPPEQWPRSLKTGVRIILGSRFPMFIWWTRDFVSLHNDAYVPMLGKKHPAALARPAREVWSEIWDVVGPLASGVIDQGQATFQERLLLLIERRGYLEETYFTFSYSPMPADDGSIGGVYCAVMEDTAQVVSERRLETLRELAAGLNAVPTTEAAFHEAARILGTNPYDLPFLLLYRLSDDADALSLVAAAGVEQGESVSPRLVPLDGSLTTAWPFAESLERGRPILVDGLAKRSPSLPGGPLAERAECALVIPIPRAGESRPEGFMVAGVSPRRELDEAYRGFLDTVAANLASGVATASALEQERERARALAELDQAKTTFFSNVSHEFRTPLTLILGPMEDMLDRQDSLSVEERDSLEMARRNGLRLLRLVNDLLDVTRIDAGRMVANRELTDLAGYTGELASMFRSAAERAGLELRVDCPARPLAAWVDREMWEKIVLNLLSNALKYTFEGSISVRLRSERGQVKLEVTDTGVGMPADQLPRVFERFHRVSGRSARSQEGTGIGLALVNEQVRLHGGTVKVRSEVGRGTSFLVAIPVGAEPRRAEQRMDQAKAASVSPAALHFVEEALRWLPTPVDGEEESPAAVLWDTPGRSVSMQQPARVLLAEDNPDMREYVRRLLAERWQVRAEPDGQAALTAVREWRPDLVLADVMMPRLDGFELLRELRADPSTRAIPIILLSARAGEESRVEGMQAGADDYLVKPFSARELIARVEGHLRLAHARAELGRQEREARDYLSRLFEQAPAAVSVLNGPDHVYTLANAAYRALVGEDELLGKPIRLALPELDDQGLFEALDQAYASGEPVVEIERPVTLNRGGTRMTDYLNLVYAPLRNAAGTVEGVFVYGSDVSAQVRAREQVENAVRARDEFLSVAAHELRTPVTGIRATAQLALRAYERGTLDVDRSVAAFRVINRTTDRLRLLISDLLDVSRLQGGQLSLRLGPVEVLPLVQRLVQQTTQDVGVERNIHVDAPAEALVIEADEIRLEQVLGNLLDNAAKYSPDGGDIDVRITTAENGVAIDVRDNGIGLSRTALEPIFEPFGRADNARLRNLPGVGLGLYVSRRIAALHGGRLWAESGGEGHGTTMHLWLPKAPVLQPEAAHT